MISHNERIAFKRRGYLVLDDLIPSSAVSAARSVVWDKMPVSSDSPVAELQDHDYHRVNDIEEIEPFTTIRKSIFEYADELVGTGSLEEPRAAVAIPERMQLPVNYPSSGPLNETYLPRIDGGHVDGYGLAYRDPEDDRAGVYDYYTIGATIYLNDVVSGGGGFTVFPGSHWIAEQYYRDHSLQSLGWLGDLPAPSPDGGWNYEMPLHDQVREVEITGEPGTVVLWHGRLLHGAGRNQRTNPRIAAITRFSNPDGAADKQTACANLWNFWPGMDSVEVDFASRPMEADELDLA